MAKENSPNSSCRRNVQPPTEEPGEFAGQDSLTTRHPAFAMIGASRRSGTCVLHGSDFIHHNSVAITIKSCELHRHLNHDWPHAVKELIEVELSEAQWATLVSSLNVGDGVQCTLRYKDAVEVPNLPDPLPRDKQHMDEAMKTIENALSKLTALEAKINTMKVSQKQKDELLNETQAARREMQSNAPFVVECFAKHMEGTVEKAKIEVNAYATRHLIQTGIAALGNAQPAISLPEPDPTNDPSFGPGA